ncbi:peptidylprolyl isomerase [Commensalibacter oyaizuii]|uniref:Parvulin-like PPIase n=1 Tax=Commensalibacter oyaizuii TaxID=3043873 RepID=A0ABT6Q0V3_9PROT|nr:peptidylprolyl isomerase [Commensalibacter sp. TBRC 16381]MDI2090625.1 peptidylprolyl isomerase [Commensalibacter sp. TBRC 16381]
MIYTKHKFSQYRSTSCLALMGIFLAFAPATTFATSHKGHHASTPQSDSQIVSDGYSSDSNQASTESKIVAIINGQLLTQRDINNREKLFQLTAGIRLTPDVLQRMRPQLIKQLITERLHTQEMLRRNINISPEQIAQAIADIEKRNNMPPNALRDRLSQDGVSLTTLIDQIRLQLGWGKVIQQDLGSQSRITAQEVEQRQKALKHEVGRPEYLISEIFVPVENARHPEQELQFTKTIIQQLRNGAPFPIVAAQFSQAQSALQGGALGWVQEDNLDPEVAAIARKMPIGAISNPIQVAGGYIIATLGGRRTIGNEMGTLMKIKQVFIPFSSKLNPQHPTPQQVSVLNQVNKLRTSMHSCQQAEEANQKAGNVRPSDPGEVQLERLNPEMANILQDLQPGQVSKPLVSVDGIALLMVCSREKKNIADISASEIANQLLNQRVEQISQQLDRDLHRQAIIEIQKPDNGSSKKTSSPTKDQHK